VRDQCIEARWFSGKEDIDNDILDEALHFCINNGMVSISNLKESYKYYLTRNREESRSHITAIANIYSSRKIITPGVEVARPDIDLYQHIIRAEGGEQ
jgi:hypothetical protein